MRFSQTFLAFLLLTLITFDLVLAQLPPFGSPDPDCELTIEQLVHARGFALETHTAVTEDEYLLTIHRLMPRHYSSRNYTATRKPVIVQHGLFGASTDFLINTPHLWSDNSAYGDNFGFALLLTERYDVWLPNTRGNEYSQQHMRFHKNPHTHTMDNLEYWNFSFDQMARYDLPVIIDKVRSVTGYHKVGYVGYSQGATAMFALLSMRPEFASLISPFIAWAPVVYMAHIESPFRYLAPMTSVLRLLGNRFAPSSHLISSLSHPLCRLISLETICTNGLFLFGGFDIEHLNRTRLPVYFHFTPSTSSTWQVVHFLQLITSDRFAKFDYGTAEANTATYGQPVPPEYPLANIPTNLTIVIVRSDNDYLSSIPDTDRLLVQLRNRGCTPDESARARENVHDYRIPDPVWAHLDFTLGTEAGRLVYDKTIDYLDRFT